MARSRNRTLGAAVRQLREERGLSREVLAVAASLTTGTFARPKLAQSDPSWSTINAIATALELAITELAAAVEAQD